MDMHTCVYVNHMHECLSTTYTPEHGEKQVLTQCTHAQYVRCIHTESMYTCSYAHQYQQHFAPNSAHTLRSSTCYTNLAAGMIYAHACVYTCTRKIVSEVLFYIWQGSQWKPFDVAACKHFPGPHQTGDSVRFRPLVCLICILHASIHMPKRAAAHTFFTQGTRYCILFFLVWVEKSINQELSSVPTYMYIYIYIYIIQENECMHIIYTYMYIHTHTYIYTYIYVCIYICMYFIQEIECMHMVCVGIYIYTWTCVYIYILRKLNTCTWYVWKRSEYTDVIFAAAGLSLTTKSSHFPPASSLHLTS